MRPASALRPYQGKAIEHLLSHPQGGLFLDMGLGKTVAGLTAVFEFLRFGVGPTLVVGPIRVIEAVWRQEAKRWEHTKGLTFSLVRGNESKRISALNTKADIYLINPEQLVWLFEYYGKSKHPFETLIVDESSMFKNVSTKRFRTIRGKIESFSRRYIFTGTPTPNRLLELWTQIYILDQGKRLGTSYGRFKERYFYPVDHWGYKWEPRPGAREAIYEAISDLVLRMDAKDYLDLPELIYNRVECPLPAALKSLYKGVEEEAFAQIDNAENITALNVVGAMMKCRQIANGVVYTEVNGGQGVKHLHNEKLNACHEIIEETGSPVIVVYNFKHELEYLKEHLKEFNPVVLVTAKDTAQVVDDFNAGKIRVLLLHPASGGHGLNLQEACHTMIWFGLTFSYEQYVQTIARINRQGQTMPVMLHVLVAPGTVDDMLVLTLAAKAKGQNELFTYLKLYREGGRKAIKDHAEQNPEFLT
jgi:SNF2 family DNA or RNA helicase